MQMPRASTCMQRVFSSSHNEVETRGFTPGGGTWPSPLGATSIRFTMEGNWAAGFMPPDEVDDEATTAPDDVAPPYDVDVPNCGCCCICSMNGDCMYDADGD
jgi:hypothetical protein